MALMSLWRNTIIESLVIGDSVELNEPHYVQATSHKVLNHVFSPSAIVLNAKMTSLVGIPPTVKISNKLMLMIKMAEATRTDVDSFLCRLAYFSMLLSSIRE